MFLWPAILKSGATDTRVLLASYTKSGTALPNRSRESQCACHFRGAMKQTNCRLIRVDLTLAAVAVKIQKKLLVIFKTKVSFISFQKPIWNMENLLKEWSPPHLPGEEWWMQRNLRQNSCKRRFKNRTRLWAKDYQAGVGCVLLRLG